MSFLEKTMFIESNGYVFEFPVNPLSMWRYKGAGKITTPPVPAPPAIPVVSSDTGDFAMKEQLKKSGYQKTILAGAVAPVTNKKRILG